MTTQEERLNILERKVAKIEFERLSEKKIAPSTTDLDELYDAQQVNHRLTMLLGMVTGQESAIKSLAYELRTFKQAVIDRFDQVDRYFDAQETHFDMHQKRIDSLEQNMNNRFEAQDKRFDAIDARFDTIDARFDRLEKLLLDRLPPA